MKHVVRRLSLCLAALVLSGTEAEAQEAQLSDCRGVFTDVTTYDGGFQYLYDCVGLLSRALSELEARAAAEPAQTEFVKPEMYGPGWSTYGGYRNFEYGKDAFGRVHLRGLMSGCPSRDNAIFTLPDGYRPKGGIGLIFTSMGNGNATARVDVRKGEVYYWWTDGEKPCPGWLTLDGISFQAEQ